MTRSVGEARPELEPSAASTGDDDADRTDGRTASRRFRWLASDRPVGPLLVLVATAVAGLALVTGTIGPPLIGHGVFLGSDVISYAYPWRAFIDPVAENVAHHGPIGDTVDSGFPARVTFFDGLGDGHFLGWDPYVAGGRPLGGQSTNGVLGPFALIAYLLTPSWYAPALIKLLTMAASGGFTFLFCRRLGTGRAPALFAGIAFAGSGFMVMWTNWAQVEVAALIPALFWAAERFLQRPRVVTAAPIALAVAAMLLGQFPAVVLYALYVLVPYVVVRTLSTSGQAVRRTVAKLAGAGAGIVAGVLLVAVTLLPFALGLGDTGTGERAETPQNHLQIPTLVTTVAPTALGLSTEGQSDAYFGPHNQVEGVAFVGVTTALLAVLALALPRPGSTPRGVRELLAGATLVLGWATFVGGDVLAVLQHLPAFDNSFVGRTRSVLGFMVAVLAALGLQAIADRRWPSDRRQRLWALTVTGALAVAVAVVAVRALDLARSAERVEVLRAGLVLAALVGVLAAGAIAAACFGGRRVAAFGFACLPALLVAESLHLSLPLLPNEDREVTYPTTPGIDYLMETVGDERIAAERVTLLGSGSAVYGLRSLVGHAFYLEDWKEALLAVDPSAYSQSPTFPHMAGSAEVMGSPLLDRMAVDWFVGSPQTPPPGEREGTAAADATCERTVPLADGLTANVPAGPGIRGVVVRLCEPAQPPHGAAVTAAIEGSAMPGRAYLPSEVPAGELVVALPAEELRTSSPSRLRLSLDGAAGQALTVAATPDGDPVVDVIRPAEDGLRLVYADDLRIYERTRSSGRFRWAGRAEVVADPDERLERLAAGDVPEGTILLSDDGPEGEGEPARLAVARDGADSMAVNVEASGDGYLVVADSIRRDWVVTVDGEPVDLVAADHAAAAVPVPEGRHEVELRYRPPGQQAGLGLSGLAAVVLVGSCAWDVRRNRSRARARAARVDERPANGAAGAGRGRS